MSEARLDFWKMLMRALCARVVSEWRGSKQLASVKKWKSGSRTLTCQAMEDMGKQSIENDLELYAEHLIIFCDAKNNEQLWQFQNKQVASPKRIYEVSYNADPELKQEPQLLYQKAGGLFFEIDDEDNITIIDVLQKANAGFEKNNEKVTKSFYSSFKNEHSNFLKFMSGIDKERDKEWYASLLLNRLMFCYFIQKKGFLDGNINYLQDKLTACQEKKGKDKFYSFYRNFLIVLFHNGLGAPEHSATLKSEIGNIPYLNGGLFDKHELEKTYSEIEIKDEAFERIFNFFDQYAWHLDTRSAASGKDINPDVIGYIFEKYINERAAMGAYYTKEDITDYISKNCILPFLFNATEQKYPQAFSPDGELWTILKQSEDKYIYDALKKGSKEELPAAIAAGLSDVTQREEWNKPAPEDYALPTEIWREVIERRTRYKELNTKITQGEIKNINDFISINLNISQFAHDAIEASDDKNFIKHFYTALRSVTILDPTCGSGAFLFAAMNILETLYEACLERMRAFIEDEDRSNNLNKDHFKNEYKDFRIILEEIKNPVHPNQQYFIYKNIILNNLYGVDLMQEATEIAKLRLFLKLVACVEVDLHKNNMGLEPLPDIDFNIKCGNSLVGFASKAEIDAAHKGKLDYDADSAKLEEHCDMAARASEHFKNIQLGAGDDYASFKNAKDDLAQRLKDLNHELNLVLHKGMSPHTKFDKWLDSHKPFNWYAEFYHIIHDKGGFDVIIGNPPYVNIKSIPYTLKVTQFKCSDLWGYVIHRCFQILNKKSRYGFIVMHNLAFSKNFNDVRKLLKTKTNRAWFSFYGRIPAGLFAGDVRVRNCIFITEQSENSKEKKFYTSRMHRWFSETRENLFPKLSYTEFLFTDVVPMFYNNVLRNYFEKSSGQSLSLFSTKKSSYELFYKQSAYNWIAVSSKPAPCYDSIGKSIIQSQVKSIFFTRASFKRIFHIIS